MARFSTYTLLTRVAVRQTFEQRAELIGRLLLYGLILLIFSRIFRAAHGGQADPAALSWYLATTEWIVLSLPMTHLEIERDVRTGDLAGRLARPMSYLGQQLAEGFGAALARLMVLGPAGFAFTWAVTGALPPAGWGFAAVLPLGVLAVALGVTALAAVGLGAFWLQETTPLYWVWQKLGFVFGGLLLPLAFYPNWFSGVARFTPFAAMLNLPAALALSAGSAVFCTSLAALAFWLPLQAALAALLYRRALTILDINGG